MRLKGADPVAMVTPKYANGTKFPFSVGLPLWVCQAAKIGRQIVISGPDQKIPLVIAEWMADDHRHCDKLVEGQSFSADEQSEEPDDTKRNDFTLIKGIGPAVTEKLYALGINTFDQLVAADTDYLVAEIGKPMSVTKIERIKKDIDLFNAIE